MISISCGGSESSNETAAPQENQSQESQTPETSEESPEAGEETPAPETADEKLCKEQHPDWENPIPAVDEDGNFNLSDSIERRSTAPGYITLIFALSSIDHKTSNFEEKIFLSGGFEFKYQRWSFTYGILQQENKSLGIPQAFQIAWHY